MRSQHGSQHQKHAASVKNEFAAMNGELAKELRAELKSCVQQDIAKSCSAMDNKRKAPKTSLGQRCSAGPAPAGSR